jgi:hypothetical protein
MHSWCFYMLHSLTTNGLVESQFHGILRLWSTPATCRLVLKFVDEFHTNWRTRSLSYDLKVGRSDTLLTAGLELWLVGTTLNAKEESKHDKLFQIFARLPSSLLPPSLASVGISDLAVSMLAENRRSLSGASCFRGAMHGWSTMTSITQLG